MRRACVVIAVAAGCCPVAHADVAGLNFWDARVEFGVFADGGTCGNPDQGQAALSPGLTLKLWEMTDGVAHAEVRAESTLTLDESPSRLWVSIELATVSQADVGDNPEYSLERGVAEARLESAVFDVTVLEQSFLSVRGAQFGAYTIGTHMLEPGDYLLDLSGTLARSSVDVGANAASIQSGFLFASFEITAVPPPGGAALLAMLGAGWPRRRPR